MTMIQPMRTEHLSEYAVIYAAAFSGEPWHDAWRAEDAALHGLFFDALLSIFSNNAFQSA